MALTARTCSTLSSGKNEASWPKGKPRSGLCQYQPWSWMSRSEDRIWVWSQPRAIGVEGSHCQRRSDHAPTPRATSTVAAIQGASRARRGRVVLPVAMSVDYGRAPAPTPAARGIPSCRRPIPSRRPTPVGASRSPRSPSPRGSWPSRSSCCSGPTCSGSSRSATRCGRPAPCPTASPSRPRRRRGGTTRSSSPSCCCPSWRVWARPPSPGSSWCSSPARCSSSSPTAAAPARPRCGARSS